MNIELMTARLIDTSLDFVLKVSDTRIFNSKCNDFISLISEDKYIKTIPISKDEYEKLTSKDIIVAKMISNIIIHRYTKLNIDEGEE